MVGPKPGPLAKFRISSRKDDFCL